MPEQLSEDFLGRAWVPITLGIVVVTLVGAIAASAVVAGFLLTEMVLALSITLRLTWDRQCGWRYITIVAAFAVGHLIIFATFYDSFSRAPGAVYALTALADAIIMTTLIRMLVRN